MHKFVSCYKVRLNNSKYTQCDIIFHFLEFYTPFTYWQSHGISTPTKNPASKGACLASGNVWM